MSSLEMVDYINAMRQPGEAELRYGHFMDKVPKVLGELTASEFSVVVPFAGGNGAGLLRKVYNFPKREACLMAMSYSYDLQAKVYDRMTALEAGIALELDVLSFEQMSRDSGRSPQGCAMGEGASSFAASYPSASPTRCRCEVHPSAEPEIQCASRSAP